MSRWRKALAVIGLAGFILLPFGLLSMHPQFSFIYFIIIGGFILGLSVLFPYSIGVAIRKVSYVLFFLGFLVMFGVLLETTIKKEVVEPSVENCANFFFPTNQQGSLLENALLYTSCILTGKFPKEQGGIGWGVFFLFYIILPFTFIFALLYGLTMGIGLADLFGGKQLGRDIAQVLSFVISMYATRALVGAFILQLIGYGGWGLVVLVGSVFLTAGIRKIVERFFKIEKEAEEIQKALSAFETTIKQFSIKALPILSRAQQIAQQAGKINNVQLLQMACNILLQLKEIEEYQRLPQSIKDSLDKILENVKTVQTLEDLQKFDNYIIEIKAIIGLRIEKKKK